MAATTLRKKYTLLLEKSNTMCDEFTALLQLLMPTAEERLDVAFCKQLRKLFWAVKFINSDMIDNFNSLVVKTSIMDLSSLNKTDAKHLNSVLESAMEIVATFIEIKNVEEHYTRLKSPQ